jgi:threonine/homoserine/homoserine lactone efflux protein
MIDSAFSGPIVGAFVVASLILAVTPGPGVLYIVTRSLAHGRRAGMASVAGVALGNLGNAWGAALGLGVVFSASAAAFTIVKYAGALYLVWLGIRALSSRRPAGAATTLAPLPTGRLCRDGFFVALLNPKTALFFAAFLPQFMSPEYSVWVQSVLLGATFVVIAMLTDTVYALSAGTLAPRLARRRALLSNTRYAVGGVFLGLGLYTAFSGSRSAD